jgi:hypothetical protein
MLPFGWDQILNYGLRERSSQFFLRSDSEAIAEYLGRHI